MMIEVVSMLMAIAFIYLSSLYLKPTTGITRIDNFISYVNAQRSSMANASVMVGLIVLFAQYSQEYSELQ